MSSSRQSGFGGYNPNLGKHSVASLAFCLRVKLYLTYHCNIKTRLLTDKLYAAKLNTYYCRVFRLF